MAKSTQRDTPLAAYDGFVFHVTGIATPWLCWLKSGTVLCATSRRKLYALLPLQAGFLTREAEKVDGSLLTYGEMLKIVSKLVRAGTIGGAKPTRKKYHE